MTLTLSASPIQRARVLAQGAPESGVYTSKSKSLLAHLNATVAAVGLGLSCLQSLCPCWIK